MRHIVHLASFALALMLAGHRLPAQHAHTGADTATHDSTFAAMQERGRMVMGVDQYTSSHRFDDLPDGGRITLLRAVDDTVGAARIRSHLRAIASAFAAGDFSSPMIVHAKDVPGTRVMSAKRAVIRYSVRALERGGELTIRTRDPDAIRAVHEFLAFQRAEHHAMP
ncbi:MAG TPA: hypothetical protein VN607_01785 [Gemmatimonadaceae bacterium]|nr:hypothetical protein [Gemmatimonadaceae bacterium]